MNVCPVCWRVVARTMRGRIAAHFDTTGRQTCPASGVEFHITIQGRREVAA